MKFFHISDLHIGRQMNGYSLRDSQENALSRIIAYGAVRETGRGAHLRRHL